MRVLVTGGTGFIGARLVRALHERGEDVVVLTRGHPQGASPRNGSPKSVSHVQWTPEEPGPWLEEVRRADAVVHLAGAGVMDERWTEERLRVLRSSRVQTTRLISEEIARTPSKPRVFVSASAVGYYGMRDDAALCDEDSPVGDDVLAQLCLDWERSADPARSAGVRVVHPRIGIVLGPEGGALAEMLPPFRAFAGGPIGPGTQYISWIHVHDTVRALLFAIDSPGLDGPCNVTAPEPVTMDTLAKEIGAALGRPSMLRVPAFALRLALGARSEVLLTGQRAVPNKLLASGFGFVFPQLRCTLNDVTQAPIARRA